MRRTVIVIALAMLFCGGCKPLAERAVYAVAREALPECADLPERAEVGSRKEADVYVCKNAARVDIPYSYENESGSLIQGRRTIWVKRVARRWEFDRCVEPVQP